LSFEASVGGAIPILRPLRDSLSGDKVNRIMGIVNGTTNYILDQMDTTGASFHDALAEAQRLGYAEADPAADVEGEDAAAKAAILAHLAFHTPFTLDQVYTEGISKISDLDHKAAANAGYIIKLLAIAEQLDDPAGSLNPYMTAKPAIGVAVPVAPFTKPDNAIILPDVAPPKKLVPYTGIGLAEIISTCESGSIATEMVVFLSP